MYFDFSSYSVNKLCPWTKLALKPLGQYQSENFSLEFLLLGERTIIMHRKGSTLLSDTKAYLDQLDGYLDQLDGYLDQLPEGKKAILIEDYTYFIHSDMAAKSHYVQRLKSDQRIEKFIFVNPSRVFKLLILMGPRIYKPTATFHIANNFVEALYTANLIQSKPTVMSPHSFLDLDSFSATLTIPNPYLFSIELKGNLRKADEVLALFDSIKKLSFHHGLNQIAHGREFDFFNLNSFSKEAQHQFKDSLLKLEFELNCIHHYITGIGYFNFWKFNLRNLFNKINYTRIFSKSEAIEFNQNQFSIYFKNAEYVDSILEYLAEVNSGGQNGKAFLEKIHPEDTFRPVFEAIAFMHADFEVLLKERDEKEKELILAKDRAVKSDKAKTLFLNHMSHELRTPLNGILGMNRLLEMSELDSLQIDCVATIRDSGQELLDSLQKILHFTEIYDEHSALTAETIDLKSYLERLAVPFQQRAQEKSLDFRVEFEEPLPERILADESHLQLVLEHLLDNAVKFTEEGFVLFKISGKILSSHSCELLLEIIDSGIGIGQDFQERIFEPFTQFEAALNRSYAGVGLGLTIAKKIVESMKGEIHFESDEGRGTHFYVVLNVEIPPEQSYSIVPELPSDCPVLHLLLVEDNAVNQKVALRLLEKMQHQVTVASNGIEALKLLTDRTFDLILMDVQMPLMDGIETTKHWRQIEKATGRVRTPIVALTAHALSQDKRACYDAGMDDYLTKPIQYHIFEKCLQKWSAKK